MAIVQPKSVKYRVWATHLVMWGFLALIIFPVIMVIAISFRTGNFSVGEIIPSNPTLDHWRLALGMSITNADGSITPPPFPVLTWLWNSIKIAGITALMIVTLSTTCAYAFARLRFRGKSTILQGMLIFQMFPAVLALVAIYALFNKIGDYVPWLGLNTHGGLILLPLSVPILAVVFILAFIGTITEVPVASILLQDVNNLTLSVGAQQYLYPQNYLWGDFAAAAVLSGLPITVVFLMAQRWLVGGLTAGGVKG